MLSRDLRKKIGKREIIKKEPKLQEALSSIEFELLVLECEQREKNKR